MRPDLFHVFGIVFPAYFVLLATGFLFATAAGALWARRIGEDPDIVVDLGIAMLISGVAGGRLLHVLADGYFWDYVHLCTDPAKVDWQLTKGDCLSATYGGVWDAVRGVCHPQEADCFAWAKFWAGGLTYYGGFIGASIGAYYLLKRDRFPFWKAADMAGFTVPLGLAMGRMGCLLAGCCFGTRTAVPWALSFPGHSAASESEWKQHLLPSLSSPSLPVHPTQIYESAASLAISAVCMLVIHPRKRYDGQVFASFVVLYAAARFVLEFWRDDNRGGFAHLSTSQLLGIAFVGAAIALHLVRSRQSGSLVPPSL
jgi:phosphatidylglycerol---prolipoprotein diacylglyceryl transferase